MENIFFNDSDDLIDIRYDNVFKAVFTRSNPASKGALSRLIYALIGRSVSVEAITANEPPIDNIRDRQIRYDISCRTENGELVNVEMSLNPAPYELSRLEFYAGKLFTGQDIRGADYNYDDLKEAFQIAILASGLFFPDDNFFHVFEYYDLTNCVTLNSKSRIITLELSKLDKVIEKPTELMSNKEYWAVFFRYLTDKSKRQKINEIMAKEEGIKMASEVLMTISKDEIERARLLSELKYELDLQSLRVTAQREGRAEGRAEGKAEGRKEGREEGHEEGRAKGREEALQETARKMKDMGLSTEQIREATGLTSDRIDPRQDG